MSHKICPYPGLRPFTQEEAIFFKGRDVHIRQIVRQLEERKIVMITGASGDGKSSLVYAGVIPSAKAGFFRAMHTRWLICDFRPERSPLRNLAAALSSHFQMETDEIFNELQYGFSALVDLYQSTTFFLNTNSPEFQKLTDEEKRQKKFKAANLFILADQFEEMFTNNENFSNGKPSNESYTAVNLLLETAKIALEKNLPIYIAFTMRSDFISQSVAFKGLPETIGFSQFFVPRLKRHELQQAIEEPALLAGGKISKRLTELLINHLRDGFDRLPVLQHCLNRLWYIAEEGKFELDLIHLAKLSGINFNFLSQEDADVFTKWFENIEEKEKKFFQHPSLDNVLNTHATRLYETSFEFYQKNISWAPQNISQQHAHFILKKTFQSLTKIDFGRSVRNRMTLMEITQIIDQPNINYETVCGILTVFRLPDSTFVRPFFDPENIETQYLKADAILDITHEALIRNWKLLQEWEKEEEENVATFFDFKQQLQRWLEHQKSNGFLLPVGPLSFFETWYEKCLPNKFWIAKYDSRSLAKEEKLSQGKQMALDIIEFLKKSRNFLILQEKKKKRLRISALIFSILTILVLSALTYWALNEKNYALQQKQLAVEKTKLAEFEKNKAVEANDEADLERKKAKQSASEAWEAKKQSDEARTFAEKMRLLAEGQTFLAKQESENTKIEKSRSDSLRIIAENQKQLAEKQRQLALSASDTATKLSYLALAQSLGLKATTNYSDKSLNSLLAFWAYQFHTKNGGNIYDPVIYNGLRFAANLAGKTESYDLSEEFSSDMEIFGENILISFRNGIISNAAKNSIRFHTNFEIPVNQSFLISEKQIIYSLENKRILYFDIEKNKSLEFLEPQDLVRGAILLNDKNTVVLALRSGKIYFYSLTSQDNKPISILIFDSRIKNLIYCAEKNSLFAGFFNGEIFEISAINYQQKKLSQNNFRVESLCFDKKNNSLVAGFSDGKIKIISLAGKFADKEILVSSSVVESVCVDNSGKWLGCASADGVTKLFRLTDLNEKPLILHNSKQKIKKLRFNSDGELYGLSMDKKVYFWETDVKNYANFVEKSIKRNFSESEWQIWIGKNVPYQKK